MNVPAHNINNWYITRVFRRAIVLIMIFTTIIMDGLKFTALLRGLLLIPKRLNLQLDVMFAKSSFSQGRLRNYY
jgi:hypothetical protein